MATTKNLTIREVAALLRVSERYLLDVVVARGELMPIAGNTENLVFDEAVVLAYVKLDTKRRKDALRRMAREEQDSV